MLFNKRRIYWVFSTIMLFAILLLTACGGTSAPEAPIQGNEPAGVDILSHAGARDLAVSYLLEEFALQPPATWTEEDQTPEGLLGSSAFVYTSAGWSAQVSAPVVAPEFLVYTVKIDHLPSGLHWEGEVNPSGEIRETSIVEPYLLYTAKDAANMAAIYIVKQFGWRNPGEWVEEPAQEMSDGATVYTFRSEPWIVRVEYRQNAPFVPEYHITADHVDLLARWTGTISARGDITEEQYLIAD